MKPESIEKQLMTLDDDEKELFDSIENDEWIPNYETSGQFELRKVELMEAARETLNFNKNIKEIEIIIHIPQNIFQKIKMSAERSGIHYQNWIINTLQKVVSQ